MRLTCPGCAAIYEVEEGAVPPEGRKVQCSACGAEWLARSDRPVPDVPPPRPAEHGPGEPAPGPRERGDRARDILREEAAREAAARRTHKVPRAGTWPLDGDGDEARRRDPRLPDPDRIAATLSPLRPAAVPDDPAPVPPDPQPPRPKGFGLGFASMIALAAILVLAYLLAPRIAEAVAALEGPLAGYVAGVDALRVTIDAWVTEGSAALRGLLGGTSASG